MFPFSMPERSCQDVSVVICDETSPGAIQRYMNSLVMHNAVPVQHTPSLFHGRVPMFADLQTSLSQLLTFKTALPESAHMQCGTRPVESHFSNKPSVIRHLRVPYASVLVPAVNIRNEVSFPASGGHGKCKKPLVDGRRVLCVQAVQQSGH